MKWTKKIAAIDFDGTCTTHDYPLVGQDVGAVPVLLDMVKNGWRLILYTMRSGAHLDAAVQWFQNNGIELWGVQTNPEQASWTQSPKCYAEVYIDDAALGCPLVVGEHRRPFVDWAKVRELLGV